MLLLFPLVANGIFNRFYRVRYVGYDTHAAPNNSCDPAGSIRGRYTVSKNCKNEGE